VSDVAPLPVPADAPLEPSAGAPLRGFARVAIVWTLAILGGIGYGLHVEHTSLAMLAWVTTSPWLVIAVHPRLEGRGNFAAYCVGLFLMAEIGVSWLKGQGTGAWLVAPLLYWPLFTPAWFLVRAIRRRWPAFPLALAWPVIFTGVEWLRLQLSPGELALCVLGYSQIVLTRMVQVADLGGVAMVTFWLAAIHGLIADAVIAWTSGDRRKRVGVRRSLVLQAAGVVALVAAVAIYGAVRDTEAGFTAGPRLHVLQPNTPRSNDPEVARAIHDRQVLETLSTARPDCDAILWPENSITIPYGARDGRVFPYFIPDLISVARRLNEPILVDGWRHAPELGGDVHTALLVMPDGSAQDYDKVRLLPWTEIVPGRSVVRMLGEGALGAWNRFVGRFVGLVPEGVMGSMDDIRPMVFTGHDGRTWRFGTPVCFEIATARVVNRWNKLGIDFLVNQTSEGRLGDSIHETTIAVSGFRAIEGRVSVVRAANDGISALIDPNGRPREILHGRYTGSPINEAGAFWPQVILDPRRPTVYSRIGDSFAIACLLLSVAGTIAAVVGGRRARRASPDAAVA
jgi:apolipoprotein N-acyltransferase